MGSHLASESGSESAYKNIINSVICSFNKLFNRCKNVINGMQLPDRTRIFISSMWFWAYILYHITKLLNGAIGIFLKLTPDSCIIFSGLNMFDSKTDKTAENTTDTKNKNTNKNTTKDTTKDTINKPIILDARMKTDKNSYEIITNKMRSIINNKWDIDVGNDNSPFDNAAHNDLFGGINMCDIINLYPTLSSSIVWISYLFETEKKMNNMTDAELGKKIKHMLINFTDKTINRTSDLKTPEKIIVGEIRF